MNDNISPRLMAFACFPLPPEVRLRIWHFVVSSPRIIPFSGTIAYSSFTGELRYQLQPTIRIPTHSLLLVSHEARHEALRHFPASFQLRHSDPKIPINPDIDTLYLAAHSNYITRSSLKNIKHLLIDCFY